MKRSACRNILALLISCAAVICVTGEESLVLPAPTFGEAPLLLNLADSLGHHDYLSAKASLQTLLNDGSQIMADGQGELISVDSWIDALPADQLAGLRATVAQGIHDGDSAKTPATQAATLSSFDTLYATARHSRFQGDGAGAFAGAADIMLDHGDLAAAFDLFKVAQRKGWVPDDAHGRRVNSLQNLPASAAHPVTSATVWWGESKPPSLLLVPQADPLRIFCSGPGGAFALQSSGDFAWSNISKEPLKIDRSGVWSPALFTDLQQTARIIIYRQLQPHPNPQRPRCILRACDAADGKPKWSSNADPLTVELNFAGVPSVRGGYVYCLALSSDQADPPRRNELMMVALDTLTGELRWQERVGSIAYQKDQPLPASEICVSDDALYLASNLGFVGCLDRFNGQIRWLRKYDMSDRHRWRGECVRIGNLLVTAPVDSADLTALDAATGKKIWKIAAANETLIGQFQSNLILATPQSIVARQFKDGESVWTWQPAASHVSGPSAVRDKLIIVPTNSGTIALDASNGQPASGSAPDSSQQNAFQSPLARKVLEEIGAKSYFTQPATYPTTRE